MKAAKINRKFILCAVLTLAIVGILLVPMATVSAAYPPATFTQDWPLQMVGASTVNVTQAQFEAMAAAHPASYTDNVGNVWDGVAMWRLVALVDDADNTTFNSAAVNVCTVQEIGCDNYTPTPWAGSILVSSYSSSDNYAMVADLYNGNPLPLANPTSSGKPWYPVRAVGTGIGGTGGSKTASGLIEIELLNLPVTTVSVSPSSQAVANGASFTVNLDINTNQQSHGWGANVNFDASKLIANSVSEGTFLSAYATPLGGGTVSGGAATINNTAGTITIPGYVITEAGTGGPTGTGTLCTISFTAKTGIDNYASIGLPSVVVSDQNANSIPGVVATGGTVAIGNVPMPDLVVSALSAAKVSDTTYTITYTITNQGNLGAGACSTSIVIDGGAPITLACPALAASAFDTETTAAQTISGSTDTILVTADSAGVVTESSETNNSSQIVYALAYDYGNVIVNGNILAKLDLTLTPPSDFLGWVLQQGANNDTGSANVKCNTPWQLQVNDQNANTNGHMTKWNNGTYDTSVKLVNPLTVGSQVSVALSGSNQTIAIGDTSGQNLDNGQNLTIFWGQQVVYSDPVLSTYSYHIVVTFTASSTLE